MSPAEIARRSVSGAALSPSFVCLKNFQVESERRHIAARSCSGSVDTFTNQRRAKRSLGLDLERRDLERKLAGRQEASSTNSAAAPHYTEIQK